jgi:hypothetical protein
MGKKNAAQNLLGLLGLGSREETRKPIKRVMKLSDLEQTTVKETTLDPVSGRLTSTTTPASALTPSGHYVPDIDQRGGVLGECCACRSEFEDQGQPDLITVVPAGEGGGGVCRGCGGIYCNAHGGTDEEGNFWCEACTERENLKHLKQVVVRAVLGRFSGLFGVKEDE